MWIGSGSVVKWSRLLVSAGILNGCVGTELAVPRNHPGNPEARSGTLPVSVGLRSDFDASRPQSSSSAPHVHAAAPQAAVPHACPMHPEIEQKEPGTCPKCGMKLVPRKDKK
jgi:hypothetical protein